MANYLYPLQVGVGVSGGCEAAIHATRRFMDSMSEDSVIAKLDFSNAFNSIHRQCVLREVDRFIPELSAFYFSAYGSPSLLKFGSRSISSSEGVQQGDPLGPLLFCLTLQPILQGLVSQLRVGFLDDVTVGGQIALVTQDVEYIKSHCGSIGLELNVTKCELISSCPISNNSILSSFIHVKPGKLCLLGAPLSSGQAMDSALSSRKTLQKCISV